MLAASGGPLANPKHLDGKTVLVFHGQGCAYRRRFEQWLQALRVVPARTLEFASYHALLAAAASGIGVCLIPRSVLDIYPQREALAVATVPARVAHPQTLLVAPRGLHTPALTRLVDALHADAAKPS